MIWDLETTDGVNYSALAAIHSRARRRAIRPTSEQEKREVPASSAVRSVPRSDRHSPPLSRTVPADPSTTQLSRIPR